MQTGKSALYALAAVLCAATATAPADARRQDPNDYDMICFPINPYLGYGQCLERTGGNSTWFWYDDNGGWGEGTHPPS